MSEQNESQPGVAPERGEGMPRWVKVSLIVVLILVVVFVVAQLLGGDHGPGRHLPAPGSPAPADAGEHRPPPGVDHGPGTP